DGRAAGEGGLVDRQAVDVHRQSRLTRVTARGYRRLYRGRVGGAVAGGPHHPRDKRHAAEALVTVAALSRRRVSFVVYLPWRGCQVNCVTFFIPAPAPQTESRTD